MLYIIILFIALLLYNIKIRLLRLLKTHIIKERYIKSFKLSVLVLSFNRPHNIKKILENLTKISYIDEIFILHGHPQFYREFKNPIPESKCKISNIKDFENNQEYYCARRYLHYSLCKNDLILLLDDDLIPTKKWLDNSIQLIIKNKFIETIYGSYRRSCDYSGYHIKPGNPEIILPGCSIVFKKTIESYVKGGFLKKAKPWLKKYKGNCEDLLFNLYVLNILKNKPIFIDEKIIGLDEKNGYSSQESHYKTRNEFCKKYHNWNFQNSLK